MKPGRRAFLKLPLALAAPGCCYWFDRPPRTLLPCACHRAPVPAQGAQAVHDPARLPEDRTDFPLGVMAGDVTPDAAVLWTRYTGPTPLALRVVEMQGCTVRETAYDSPVPVDEAGFVHFDLRGLRPGAHYRYAFVAPGARGGVVRGPVGRFRAALAPESMEPVTFGGTSCTHHAYVPFPVLQHAALCSDLDFFLHVGDYVYCDGSRTLEQFRRCYADTWRGDGFARLHASTGWYVIWDDHEVRNDWNPARVDPALLATARRAFFEHIALRHSPEAPERLWRRARWGRAAEFFVLDTRSERNPHGRTGPDAQFLSPTQLAWLEQGLARSNAVFKFIVTSVPMSLFPPAFALLSGAPASDRWQGYPAQRAALLEFIAARGITGVWFLSGDLHFGCVSRISPDSTLREVLMGPGGQTPKGFGSTLCGPQWEFITLENNYTRFRADPVARTLEITFINARGEAIFQRCYPA